MKDQENYDIRARRDMKKIDEKQVEINEKIAEETKEKLLDNTAQTYEISLDEVDEFIMEEYADEQSAEYLVDGAILTCSNCTKKEIAVSEGGIEYRYFLPAKDQDKVLGKLTVTENPAAAVTGLKHATVKDCKKEFNIPYFGNCKRLPDSETEMLKFHKMHNNSEQALRMRKEGSCKYLMKLNNEWENYEIGQSFLQFCSFVDDEHGERSGITMTSILFCKHGGFIYPVTSGQVMDNLSRILRKDRSLLTDNEMEELGYLFQMGDEVVRGKIFDYLFPMIYLNGSNYNEIELARHINILNNDKIPKVADKYVQSLNVLGINNNNYSVDDMKQILLWDQDKINKTYEACRKYSVESGILISPKLALAIIGAEGTGSYDTNGKVASCYNNGYGPQHDFEIDTKAGLELIKNKLSGYIVYEDEYKLAAINVGITDGYLITYLCQNTPILGKNRTGVYAEDNSWINLVEEKYQKYSKDVQSDSRDYLKDYETFLSGYIKDDVVNADEVQYEFVTNGGKVVAKVK